MAQATINIGTIPNDGTGDVMRTSFTKVNDNFGELYYTTSNLTSNLTLLDNKVDTQIGDLYLIVETSFDVANAAYTFANNQYAAMNAAYIMANGVNSLFYGAAVNAAAAFDFANSLTVKLNTNYTTTNSAYVTGNAAFAWANSVNAYAKTIFDRSNNLYDFANSTYFTSEQARDTATAGVNWALSGIANAESAYNFANGVSANTTSAYGVVNSAYTVSNSCFGITNSAYTTANAAYGRANTKVNTVNGIVTGTFSVYGSMTVDSGSSFAGYHTIDDSGSIFRTGGTGYGVRIYPPNGSGSGILQFTDVFQSTQWGSMYANNSEFGIGSSINTPVKVKVNGSTIGSFNSSGLTVTGQIWSTDNITAYYSSDITLKENIIVIDHAVDKVKQIRGVSFDWTDSYIKSHGGEDNYFMRKRDVGVIAQEVEKILPEIVADRDDGTKAVRYEKIIPLLIEAIKELSEEVERLKNASSK